jgi:hypothetical protein
LLHDAHPAGRVTGGSTVIRSTVPPETVATLAFIVPFTMTVVVTNFAT